MVTSGEPSVPDRNVEAVFVALIPDSNAIEKLSKIDPQLDANPQIVTIHPTFVKGLSFRSSSTDPIPDAFVKAVIDRANKETAGRRAALNKALNSSEPSNPNPILLVFALRGIIEFANDIVDLNKKGIRLRAVINVYDDVAAVTNAASIVEMASTSVPELGYGQLDINKPLDMEMIGLLHQILDWCEEWQQWKADVPVITLPVWRRDMEPGDSRTYTDMMNSLPATLHSVEHVLCAMLFQIQSWVQRKTPVEPPSSTLDERFASIWKCLETEHQGQEDQPAETIAYSGNGSYQRALHFVVADKPNLVNHWFLQEGIKLRRLALPIPGMSFNGENSMVSDRKAELFSNPSEGKDVSQPRTDNLIEGTQETSDLNDRMWCEEIRGEYLNEIVASTLYGTTPIPFEHHIQFDANNYIRLNLNVRIPIGRKAFNSWEFLMCGDAGLYKWQQLPEKIRRQRQVALIQGRTDVLRLSRTSNVEFRSNSGIFGALAINEITIRWVSLTNRLFITGCEDSFKANFLRDNSQAAISPNRIYSRAADGTYVSVGFDGVIFCQRRDGKLWRIDSNGIVTSRFRDKCESVLPNGAVVVFKSATEWKVTTIDGHVYNESGFVKSIKVATQTDPDSGDVVLTRDDGVMLITYAQGSQRAHVFPDWTRIVVSSERTTVSLPGAAEIVLELSLIKVSAEYQPTISVDTKASIFAVNGDNICLSGSTSCFNVIPDHSAQVHEKYNFQDNIAGCFKFAKDALSAYDVNGNYLQLESDGIQRQPLQFTAGLNSVTTVPPSIEVNSPEPRIFLLNRDGDGNGIELIKSVESSSVHFRCDDTTLVDQQSPLRLRKIVSPRRVFTSKLNIPDIVRFGAGCSTVLEVEDELSSCCILQRILTRRPDSIIH